jgi:phospholipase/lecithinase/hemolysin
LFNTTLSAALQQGGLTGKVIQVDSYTWMNQLIANYKANGFVVSNSATACNPNTTTDDTSLLCSPPNYATPNADQTYMFADSLHFTTRMHALFAELVEQQIALSGLGP